MPKPKKPEYKPEKEEVKIEPYGFFIIECNKILSGIEKEKV